jgi:small subunit ribosomal protein S13
VNTDLNGEKSVERALTEIKGIGTRIATVLTDAACVPRKKELGECTDEEIERLEKATMNLKSTVPLWLLNRQRDYETGESYHLFSTDVQLKVRDDINLMKKIRSYKGIRHEQGQKVRGQRTRSNGRTGLAVGVTKAMAAQAAAQQQAAGKEKGGEKVGKAAAAPVAPEKAATPAPEKK